ncbi:glycoside hydrolase 15 protein [Blyttiomyces sp. JEL0837]|nr:glycoside hydrolase 15 protein [Blyttiomyces sp. JEL0837]
MKLTLVLITAIITSLISFVTAAGEVKINNYQFDGYVLSGSAYLKNLAFSKQFYINYADSNQEWSYNCPGFYSAGPDANNTEFWLFRCTVPDAGISQFYASYSVNGQTYYDSNGGFGKNYQVQKTFNPPPAPPSSGLLNDVSTWFLTAASKAQGYMFANIHPAGSDPGTVAAATAQQDPNETQDYFYHWTRDSALVMDVVNTLYDSGSNNAFYEQKFFEFRDFTHKIQTEFDGNNIGPVNGEPKFEMKGGAPFSGDWCRPQLDGPGLRASTFMHFARAYLKKNPGNLNVFISQPSVCNNNNGCDLWEEIRGLHFFTAMAQRRALKEGAAFARFVVGDTGAADWYAKQAASLDGVTQNFFNSNEGVIHSTPQGQNTRTLDAAIALGSIHGDLQDGHMTPESDQVLISTYKLAAMFNDYFPLNKNVKKDNNGLDLGVAIGRYQFDTYDGNQGGNGHHGNPWYLTTLALAETYYRAAARFIKNEFVAINDVNLPFFTGAQPAGLGLNLGKGSYWAGSPQFNSIITAMQTLADLYVRRVRYHGSADFHLAEEYNYVNGFAQGIQDLTWSYASVISANKARQDLLALLAARKTSRR